MESYAGNSQLIIIKSLIPTIPKSIVNRSTVILEVNLPPKDINQEPDSTTHQLDIH